MEKAPEIQSQGLQPLLQMWQTESLHPQIWTLPYLFQRDGPKGPSPGYQKGKLVDLLGSPP